jgi:hypothetical protein
MAASLDSLGVPQEFRDRVKIMWIITLLGGLWGWIICAFIWKLPGQEQNQWFQFQLKQNLWVGVISLLTCWLGLGFLVQFIYGLLGFLAIGKGEDFEAPVIAGFSR